VSRNTEVDLFTHTEIKPGTSTGKDVPVEPAAPVEIFETVVTAATTGTVVPTALVPFLFFGLTGTVVLTGFTGLVGTVELVALLGITDNAALNEIDAIPPAAFTTDAVALAPGVSATEAAAGTVVAVVAFAASAGKAGKGGSD